MSHLDDILLGARTVMEPDHVYELRAPREDGTASGYFDDPELLAKTALQLDGHYPAIYIVLNPVHPGLIARSDNTVERRVKATTSDHDIIRRRRLLIDFDPPRPSGVSSTDDEKEACRLAALDTRQFLQQFLGDPVLADSGNGSHLLYRIDQANNDEALKLVRGTLSMVERQVLQLGYGGRVTVDQAVFNAARITKLYGTKVCKGKDFKGRGSNPARPHRRSRVVEVPPTWFGPHAVPVEALADMPVAGRAQ